MDEHHNVCAGDCGDGGQQRFADVDDRGAGVGDGGFGGVAGVTGGSDSGVSDIGFGSGIGNGKDRNRRVGMGPERKDPEPDGPIPPLASIDFLV